MQVIVFNSEVKTVADRYNKIKKPKIQKAPCLTAIARSISTDSNVHTWEDLTKISLVKGSIHPAGLTWSKTLVGELYDKYVSEYGSFIGSINKSGYTKSDKIKEVFGTICGNFPLLCDDILRKACSGVTKEQFIYLEPDAQSWCGCYMNDDQYKKYNDLGIKTECTPTCNAEGTIPTVDINYVPKTCNDTVCLIDDINLNIVNSKNPRRI